MDINKPKIIELPKVTDSRGKLTFIESNNHIPFDIKRIYYLYDIPDSETRGSHAHKELQQIIIAASGSFDIVLDDGKEEYKYTLNRSYYGLYVPKMMWRTISNFSTGSVCLVLASMNYDPNDYYRVYDDFIADIFVS
ncbi:MAG: FdtA/QdtA family cupin domain-containing protein [Gammaproteobacteria bacterium]|nr:FdtA/QdtA family cupin domain-containing protein [Gammaproteobacteria bacterium]